MNAFAIIIGSLILVFIAVYIFNRIARKGVFKRMGAGVTQVKMRVALFLNRKYRLRYDEEKATNLAVAVTNELFGDIPTKREASEFAVSNRSQVLAALKEISLENTDIRMMITQALRVKAILRYGGSGKAETDYLIRAMELGILIEGGDAPSPETFPNQAAQFLMFQNGKSENH